MACAQPAYEVKTMPRIEIDRDRCKGCELCVSACPKKIIGMAKQINRKGYFFAQCTDQNLCIGCKFCALTCPDVAIRVFGPVKKEN